LPLIKNIRGSYLNGVDMRVSLVSDLHLEFGYQELPGGEVLILAGDIAEARSISKHHYSTKLIQDTPDTSYRCSEFFKWECAKYDQVFMVMGNHEHFHNRFDRTYDELKSILPKNVVLLENEVVNYKGVMFMGATLWTDLNREDPITVFTVKDFMNDYRAIKNHYPDKGLYHKLTPEDTVKAHRRSKEYFKLMLSEHRDTPFVVITHMAPSFASVNEKYKHETIMNGAYASDLSEFILDNENIRVWVHGHMHDPVDYMIGDTRVISNPRGYIGHENTSGFNPNFYFEV
jgi:Icc-related predicted phosphoesterase